MNSIITIVKKELKNYFNSPIAYICVIFFLFLSSALFFWGFGFFLRNQADMRVFFSLMPWIFLFFAPAITMSLWAEERKSGTAEILLTLPFRDYEVVVGKFLASFILLIFMVILSFTLPIAIAYLGDPDSGPIIGGYLGTFLLGGAYLSIGLFASTFTKDQISAFILGIALSFFLFFIGENFVLFAVPKSLVPVFKFLSLGWHFDSIGRGVIDLRDIVYYLSMIGFFLYLSIYSVESRKWR